MDIRKLHKNGMQKLRNVISKEIRITYNDGNSFIVPCTITKEKIDLLKYYEIVGRDDKIFNILVDDLLKVNAPLVGFDFVEYNRVKYQVQSKRNNGIYDNIISLVTRIYRDNLNA